MNAYVLDNSMTVSSSFFSQAVNWGLPQLIIAVLAILAAWRHRLPGIWLLAIAAVLSFASKFTLALVAVYLPFMGDPHLIPSSWNDEPNRLFGLAKFYSSLLVLAATVFGFAMLAFRLPKKTRPPIEPSHSDFLLTAAIILSVTTWLFIATLILLWTPETSLLSMIICAMAIACFSWAGYFLISNTAPSPNSPPVKAIFLIFFLLGGRRPLAAAKVARWSAITVFVLGGIYVGFKCYLDHFPDRYADQTSLLSVISMAFVVTGGILSALAIAAMIAIRSVEEPTLAMIGVTERMLVLTRRIIAAMLSLFAIYGVAAYVFMWPPIVLNYYQWHTRDEFNGEWVFCLPGHHRSTSAANACINNLRQLDAAAQQFALEHHLTNGTPIHFPEDLMPYMRLDKNGNLPPCPKGGVYSVSTVGELPRCSYATNRTTKVRTNLFFYYYAGPTRNDPHFLY